MEVAQPSGGDAVPPSVLGAVREHGAVGTHRRRDPALGPVVGELVPHLPGQRDAPKDQRCRLEGLQPLVDEARDAGLVAGRGRDARPRSEVATVHLGDRLGGVPEHASGPEGFGEVVAQVLQGVRHPPVEDHWFGTVHPTSLPIRPGARPLGRTRAAHVVRLLASRAMEGRDVGELAARLRRLREAAALTQEELAERAGLTANAIGALERGERRRPYPHTLRVLADALGLDDAAARRAGRRRATGALDTLPGPDDPTYGPAGTVVGRPPTRDLGGRHRPDVRTHPPAHADRTRWGRQDPAGDGGRPTGRRTTSAEPSPSSSSPPSATRRWSCPRSPRRSGSRRAVARTSSRRS